MSSPPPGPPPHPAPPPGPGPFARPPVPGRVHAVHVMMLAGGIVAILVGLSLLATGVVIGIPTFGLGCLLVLPGAYSLTIGIVAVIRAARLLSAGGRTEPVPRTIAILQIVNVIAGDPINLVLGIVELVLLGDPEVAAWYRAR